MSYYLYVYKNNNDVISDTTNIIPVEVGNNQMPEYVLPSISAVCFLFILLFFTLLFKKNKKAKR